MIGILHDSDREPAASSLASSLPPAVADLVVQRFAAEQPSPWPHEPAWHDVLLVLTLVMSQLWARSAPPDRLAELRRQRDWPAGWCSTSLPTATIGPGAIPT